MRTTRLTRWTAALVAAAALWPAPAVAADDPIHMVALGDSAAAGPLVPRQIDLPCLRSDQNWPHLTAQALGATLTDVSCSGAVASDLTGRRFGLIAPQLDAVTADADIVTLTIGANDVGLGSIIPSCLRPLPAPFGIPCRQAQFFPPTDAQFRRIETAVRSAVRTIHAKAPSAEVYLVSYLTYWNGTGCFETEPIWSEDAVWLQGIFDRVNATLASAATQEGAAYVDLSTPSRTRGICAPKDRRWMNGLLPDTVSAPYHANAAGHRGSAEIVTAAIR